MHTWFFVYDEYMKRDESQEERTELEKQQHPQQQQVAGLNNNTKQAQPPQPPIPTQQRQHHHQYGMSIGGAMNNRSGSASVPTNLDNNGTSRNSPPPNYKTASQQQSAQHVSNHQQQYAGKEVNSFPNGQSLSNPSLDKNTLHHHNNHAALQHNYHHQPSYDQQALANHHHHSHAIFQGKPVHDLTSSSVVGNGRIPSSRPNYPPPNYSQLPYQGSQYVSGWVRQQPQQPHMINYGQHQRHNQAPHMADHQYYYHKGEGTGYGQQVHPLHHHPSHHYAQHGSQNPIVPGHHHHGQETSAGLLQQRHQSRSVPSVHDAVSGQSNSNPTYGDTHSSRNSLHETTRLNRSSVSLRGSSMHDDLSSHGMNHFQQLPHQHRHPGGGGYQPQQQFSTFHGAPYNQTFQRPPPCMAHDRGQSKKQNQRGIFMRQASAPDLPPEHSLNETDMYSEAINSNPGEFRSRSQGNLRKPPMSKMHSIDDVGYKSEGSNSRYKQQSNSGGHEDDGEFFPYNQALPNPMPFHECMGTTNPMYRRSGGDLSAIPPQPRPHSSFHGNSTTPKNNGYLSDGEGYAIRNRRISKSGRYGGSHGSSPGASGPTTTGAFGYGSHIESSRKSPYQQHIGLRQRHDTRGMSGRNMVYSSCANDRSGDDTKDDEEDDDEDEEDEDGYVRDIADKRDGTHQHRPSSGGGSTHAVANLTTTPVDTDDLDDIEDDAYDGEVNDDDVDDERDMEDTIEDGTTASATATVVAASVTAAAIKTTKSSNGGKNETDLIVSYSTYQAQTAAIGNSTNSSKINRVKIKQNKQMPPVVSNQGTTVQGNNTLGGAESSCEELSAAPVDSIHSAGKTSTKMVRSNNSSGCSIDNEEGRNNVSKKSVRTSVGSGVKNSRNNSRQGIYSSDQSSTGADQVPLPPPPEPGPQSSGMVRRRRGQMERADSQHSSSGGGGYRSEPGNCTSCGSGGKEL